MMNMNMLIFAAGLSSWKDTIINDWLGPALLIGIAAVSITFLMKREFRQLAIFVLVVAIIAAFVFGPEFFFGKDGIFTSIAKDAGTSIGGSNNSGGSNTIYLLQSIFLK